MIFVTGEMNNLAVYIISQIMSKGCCHSCWKEGNTYSGQHDHQRHQNHLDSGCPDVIHLNCVRILAHSFVFCFHTTDSGLCKNGFRHVGKLLICSLQHLFFRILRHCWQNLHWVRSFRYLHLGKHFLALFTARGKRGVHHQRFAQKIV